MPIQGRKDASVDDWECKHCKGGDKKPYRNFGFRDTCRVCRARKGDCFCRKVSKPEQQPSVRREREQPRATGGSARAAPRVQQQTAWSPDPDRDMLVTVLRKSKEAEGDKMARLDKKDEDEEMGEEAGPQEQGE